MIWPYSRLLRSAKTWAMDGLVKTWACRITDGNNGLDRMVISGCRGHCSDADHLPGWSSNRFMASQICFLLAVTGLFACLWALPPLPC